jgi:tetraacyldisaccharide 4'-kinase
MKPSFSARRLLLPLNPLHRLALAIREFQFRSGLEPVWRLRFPVVSIGNLSTGGSGKTPLTIALAKLLTAKGLQVDVLSRGYGRQSRLAVRVDLEGTAEEFGDEPLLIARETDLPVYVAPQRLEAGLLAEDDARETAPERRRQIIHLLDDGFQHRQLVRAVDILLLDRRDWQDRLLPAGNLREPLKAVRRASVIAIPSDEPELEAELRAWGWQGPVWRLRRRMEFPYINGPVAAFCGIARPKQFFVGLEAAALRVTARAVFRDHHRYTAGDIDRLIATARAAGATALVTTEKDHVRMGKLASGFPASLPLLTARLTIEIEEQAAAIDWLLSRLGFALAHTAL